MTDDDELPGRVRRAFADHDAFAVADGHARAVSTPFEATVTASERDDGRVVFAVTVRMPMLNEVTADDVADVVESGWVETFELRAEDPGAITAADHDLEPDVRRAGDEVVVEAEFADLDERRGVDAAAAVIDFVEGTYVQGVIPGYEYTEPVSSLLATARRNAASDDASRGGEGPDVGGDDGAVGPR